MNYTSANIVEIKPVEVDGTDKPVAGSKINLNPKLNKELIEVTSGPLDRYFRPNKAKLHLYETYGKPMDSYQCSIEQTFSGCVDFNRMTTSVLSCWQYCDKMNKVFLYVKWIDPNLYIKSVADLVNHVRVEVGGHHIQRYTGNFLRCHHNLTQYPMIIGSASGLTFGNSLGSNAYDVMIEIPILFGQDEGLPKTKDSNLRVTVEWQPKPNDSVTLETAFFNCDCEFNHSKKPDTPQIVEVFTKQIEFTGTESFSHDCTATKSPLNFVGDIETILFNIYYVDEHHNRIPYDGQILKVASIKIDGHTLIIAPALYYQGVVPREMSIHNTDNNLYVYTFADSKIQGNGPKGSFNARDVSLSLNLLFNAFPAHLTGIARHIYVETYAIQNNVLKIDSENGIGYLYK